ncbi:MAG: SPOR domain-containing protein [Bacteroidales bacterium]
MKQSNTLTSSTRGTCSARTSDLPAWYFTAILLALILPGNIVQSQPVKVSCQDSWGPGRYNRVTVSVDFGATAGFARLTHDLPAGFEVIPDAIGGADFSRSGDKLNIVWLKIPGEKVTISFFIKPEKSMNGSFNFESELVLLKDRSTRIVERGETKKISIIGLNGVLSVAGAGEKSDSKVAGSENRKTSQDQTSDPAVVYRVQVATSSALLTDKEVRKRVGYNVPGQMTVVRVNNLFKYQFGSFSDKKQAEQLLKELLDNGIKDAFIAKTNTRD